MIIYLKERVILHVLSESEAMILIISVHCCIRPVAEVKYLIKREERSDEREGIYHGHVAAHFEPCIMYCLACWKKREIENTLTK